MTLTGEASQMDVREADRAWPLKAAPKAASDETYYGLPILKQPVWKGWIPAYFFVGGAAGGALVLAAAAQVTRDGEMRVLVRRARWLGAIGIGVSSVLLIADLGRPARFYKMLRVLRWSSPMSVGTWVLTGAGALSGAAALFGGSPLGEAAGLAAGVFGMPLSAYTAVLIASTAVPVWSRARVSLPILFTASAAASAASVLELARLPARAERANRAFGAIGKLGEIAATFAYEHEIAGAENVRAPLRGGRSGTLWKAARALTAASLVVSAFAGRRKPAHVAGALLGVAGALALRFAVLDAGKASARDPRAIRQSGSAGSPSP